MRHTKQIQISEEFFAMLIKHHLCGDNRYAEKICREIDRKLDKMIDHDLYSEYKTALTDDARERARQAYLDRRSMPESFRW